MLQKIYVLKKMNIFQLKVLPNNSIFSRYYVQTELYLDDFFDVIFIVSIISQ